ncbi:MAG: helicase C-terminal domain-containing protein [Acidobacteriota bacterium]
MSPDCGVEIDRLFASDGALARVVPAYEQRPQQARMAREMFEALEGGHHLIIEAGTGVGKSIAYLLPAILWAVRGSPDGAQQRRVVISTHTRALQDQLVRKDIPVLERALEPSGVSFRHALLMGAENYLCVQRLHEAKARSDRDPRDPEEERNQLLDRLENHARTAPSGLRNGIPFPVPDALWSEIRRDREICLGPRGPFWERCVYRRDLARSRDAHILIVNHALFLLDIATGGRILPPHEAVVVDESHRLEEVAVSQFGIAISDLAVTRLLRDVEPLRTGRLPGPGGPKRSARLSGTIPRLAEEARIFFQEVRREAAALASDPVRSAADSRFEAGERTIRVRRPGLVANRIGEPLQQLEERLAECSRATTDQDDSLVLTGLAVRARDLRERIDVFLAQRMEDAVYWVELPHNRRAASILHVTPVEVAPILRQQLFDGSKTVALTSATLSTSGSFAHVRRRLGLTAAREVILGSPFDFESQALIYLPAAMPDPGSEPDRWADAIASQCRDLLLASDGGAFILFTSYALLGKTHDRLSADRSLHSLRFFRHQRGAATTILEEFRMTRRGVLLGTMSFWQGVDVPGEALRSVIITRLPFEVPAHPLAQARAECLKARGSDPFSDDALPEAILTLRQGFGRLVRTREDRGVVAVLDPRVLTRSYGPAFLESLPSCPRTDSIAEVERFLAADRTGA